MAAQRTSRIALGPAVLVPNLRHPLAQASAIATLEQLAPGPDRGRDRHRFHGPHGDGHRAAHVGVDARATSNSCRALLRGEKVEIDGGDGADVARPEFAPPFPISTPIVIAANGPKGMAVAHEFGDGIMTIGAGEPDFDWCSVLAFGTVLDEGESPSSERAFAAAGPALTVVYHAMYEGDPASVEGLPGGVEWRKRLEQIPEAERHLAIHKDHMVRVTERDPPLLDGDLLKAFTWTGEAAEVRMRIDALGRRGRHRVAVRADGPGRVRGSCTRSGRWRRLAAGDAREARALRREHGRVGHARSARSRSPRQAEAAGFDSIWAGEHVVLPDPQAPPSPMAPQDPALDPLLALTWAAAHTTTLRLATGIVILPQRNPVVLAKQIASLDVLSGGRFTLGLGVGYLEPEFRAIGADFANRGAVTDDFVDAMQHLWYDEHPEFHGRFADFCRRRRVPAAGAATDPDRLRCALAACVSPHRRARPRLVRLLDDPRAARGVSRRPCAWPRPRSSGPTRSGRWRSR